VASKARVPSVASLRAWLSLALVRPATVTVRFVDADEGRVLNRDYREKDYATNVLTFTYEQRRGHRLAGDLVLCAPVVEREARAQGKSVRAHYAHLVIHGALHLAGYDHQQPDEARRMEAREIRLLSRLGVSNPYLPLDDDA
jgi:probable rRNA maturation factor